jgi:hypothetical protein
VTERAAPKFETLTIRLAIQCLRGRAGTPPLTSRWRRPGKCASATGLQLDEMSLLEHVGPVVVT